MMALWTQTLTDNGRSYSQAENSSNQVYPSLKRKYQENV